MRFSKDERLMLFIDGPNFFKTYKALGYDVDFARLLQFFRQRARLVRAHYYTALDEDAEFSNVRPLVDWLEYNGFTTITKPIKTFEDAHGNLKHKTNMKVELCVDALRLACAMEHAALFSGEGDYRALVEALQAKGVRVSLVSSITTQALMIADELRRQADQFVDAADLEEALARP